MVELIGATKTKTGLKVGASQDVVYEAGRGKGPAALRVGRP